MLLSDFRFYSVYITSTLKWSIETPSLNSARKVIREGVLVTDTRTRAFGLNRGSPNVFGPRAARYICIVISSATTSCKTKHGKIMFLPVLARFPSEIEITNVFDNSIMYIIETCVRGTNKSKMTRDTHFANTLSRAR